MIPSLRSLLPAFLLAIAPLSAPAVPTPQVEHQKLAQSVGTWDATIASFGADGQSLTSQGVLVLKLGPGGFWLVEDFTGECMGTSCTGLAMLGYDPIKKVFVQSATFSMSPLLMLWTGTFDKAGKVLTMTGEAPGMDGALTRMRKVMTWVSADSMTIDILLVMPDGKEQTTMTLACARRPAKRGAAAGDGR